MYGWIWRHLPFGRPGKLLGSLLLAAGTVALLWYVVFPAIDPHLPFNNDGQVTTPTSTAPVPARSGAPAQQNQDNVAPPPATSTKRR